MTSRRAPAPIRILVRAILTAATMLAIVSAPQLFVLATIGPVR